MGKILKSIIFILLFAVLLFANIANAVLQDNGDGTITDTDTGLMWLQDANYAYTSGYDTILDLNGRMHWNEAMTWANTLVFADYDDWRLPNADPSCYGQCKKITVEMGHLYYAELGNPDNGPLINSGPFINIQQDHTYWTRTVFAPNPEGDVWDYDFSKGFQAWHSNLSASSFAMAVREITVVPEPLSSLLFIAGGTLLAGRRIIRKRRGHNKRMHSNVYQR